MAFLRCGSQKRVLHLNLFDEILLEEVYFHISAHFKINLHIPNTFPNISDLSTPALTPVKSEKQNGLGGWGIRATCFGSRNTLYSFDNSMNCAHCKAHYAWRRHIGLSTTVSRDTKVLIDLMSYTTPTCFSTYFWSTRTMIHTLVDF